MVIELNVQYAVKPGEEKRVFEILKDLRSEYTDSPHDILRKELLGDGNTIEEKTAGHGSDHQDTVSKIWAFLETPAKVRVHFLA